MQSILDAITNWIKELLIGAIESSLSGMFGDVNSKVGTIDAEVGATPQAWKEWLLRKKGARSSSCKRPIIMDFRQ